MNTQNRQYESAGPTLIPGAGGPSLLDRVKAAKARSQGASPVTTESTQSNQEQTERSSRETAAVYLKGLLQWDNYLMSKDIPDARKEWLFKQVISRGHFDVSNQAGNMQLVITYRRDYSFTTSLDLGKIENSLTPQQVDFVKRLTGALKQIGNDGAAQNVRAATLSLFAGFYN